MEVVVEGKVFALQLGEYTVSPLSSYFRRPGACTYLGRCLFPYSYSMLLISQPLLLLPLIGVSME